MPCEGRTRGSLASIQTNALLSWSRFLARGLVFAALLVALLPGSARLRAQTAASIGPAPAQLELAVGQVSSITVVLDGAQQAYGIDVRGSFDPAVIEIVAAQTNAPLVAGGFLHGFVAVNRIDNTLGTFEWVDTQLSPAAVSYTHLTLPTNREV